MAPRECKDLIQAPCAVVHCGPAASSGRVNLSTVNGQLHILQAHQRHLWNCCHCYSYHCTDSDCRAVFLIVHKNHRVEQEEIISTEPTTTVLSTTLLVKTTQDTKTKDDIIGHWAVLFISRKYTILNHTCSRVLLFMMAGKIQYDLHGQIQVLRKLRNHNSNFQLSLSFAKYFWI